MNGCVIPNTPIAVDFWKVRECPHVRLFFLTHLHGDHIAGLTSSWNYPIHCSEVTARLLKYKYALKEELLKVLEIGSPTMVFLDRENKEQMTVTALEANHCPGAVMFLFEGYFGRILHTGDFRYHPQMLLSPPLSLLTGKIDTLYLDNTYCSPRCIFPDRDEAIEMIIEIIKSHPNHRVVIAMRTLGKEDLLYTIAIQFKTWISVPSSYFDTLQILEVQNVFKNNCSDCQIQVAPFYKISNKFIANLNQHSPTIVILPTALYCGIDAEPYSNNENVFVVPYSDHSSYTELVTFVSELRPQHIVPVVKSKSRGPFGVNIADRSDMTCFQKYLNKCEKRHACVPLSVKSFMKDYQANTSGKLIQAKKRHLKSKMNRRQKQKGILYQSPRKTESSFSAHSTQNLTTALCTKSLNFQRTKETHSDNWDIEKTEVLKASVTRTQIVGYNIALNKSLDLIENDEKHQNKTSHVEKQGNLDHCEIPSSSKTTSALLDTNLSLEKPGPKIVDSENLDFNSQGFNVKDINKVIDTDIEELSVDDIFAIPETMAIVIEDDGTSNDLDIEPITCLCCNTGQGDLCCNIKYRRDSGACSQQSVCSVDYTEKSKDIFYYNVPREKPVPEHASQIYAIEITDTRSVPELSGESNTSGSLQKSKDCGNKAVSSTLPIETAVSSVDVLQSSSCGNINRVDWPVNTSSCFKATKSSLTTDRHKLLEVLNKYLEETDNEGYVWELFDGTFADICSFNFVSASARKKRFRRQRLYRNLNDLIQKM